MNCILRRWSLEDKADVAYYANNKKIADNLRDVFPYPYKLKDATNYITNCLEMDASKQINRAIIVYGKVVGSIAVTLGSDVYHKSAELGYWLAEDYWNNGIMTSAIQQICEEAFEKFDIVRIFAEPFSYNMGSRKALEKAGFELEGIKQKSVVKHGVVYDSCMYAIVR